MKNSYTLVVLAFAAMTAVALSCASRGSETTTDSLALSSDAMVSTPASLGDMLARVPELPGLVAYDEDYFNSYDTLTAIQASQRYMMCEQLDKRLTPDSVLCEDKAYFIWKKTFDDFILIDYVTTWMNVKGQCFYHHLCTVSKTGEVIDFYPEWAALYAIGVENPEGGTSAGIEIKTGYMEDNPIYRFTSSAPERAPVTIDLSSDGHFKSGILFDAETDLEGEPR